MKKLIRTNVHSYCPAGLKIGVWRKKIQASVGRAEKQDFRLCEGCISTTGSVEGEG